MNPKTPLFSLAIAGCTALATPASADLSFGGFVESGYISYLGYNYWYALPTAKLQATYETNGFFVGIGVQESTTLVQGMVEIVPFTSIYYQIGYRNFTLSYGDIEGAANLFPLHYFFYDQISSWATDTIRADYNGNGQHFAVSTVIGSPDQFEIGYAGAIGGFDIRAGYSNYAQKLGLIVGKDLGNWGYQISGVGLFNNWGDVNSYGGVTLFYDLSPRLSIAGNLAIDNTGGLLYGLIATYEAERFSADIGITGTDELPALTIGFNIPFGKPHRSRADIWGDSEFHRGAIY